MPAAALLLFALAQPRPLPPAPLPCDRNQLTSFSGRPLRYARAPREIRLVLHTDADTRESFRLRPRAGLSLESYLRFETNAWETRHWKEIESAPGALRKGVTATVWVCASGGQPLIDWRPPPR